MITASLPLLLLLLPSLLISCYTASCFLRLSSAAALTLPSLTLSLTQPLHTHTHSPAHTHALSLSPSLSLSLLSTLAHTLLVRRQMALPSRQSRVQQQQTTRQRVPSCMSASTLSGKCCSCSRQRRPSSSSFSQVESLHLGRSCDPCSHLLSLSLSCTRLQERWSHCLSLPLFLAPSLTLA